ncbi:hypothetical protein VINE108521_14385 [Vibrio neonatus]
MLHKDSFKSPLLDHKINGIGITILPQMEFKDVFPLVTILMPIYLYATSEPLLETLYPYLIVCMNNIFQDANFSFLLRLLT